MKKLNIISFLFLAIFFTSCIDNTIPIEGEILISNVIPNPAIINDTITVALKINGYVNIPWIDSLNEVSVILTTGSLVQKQKISGYSLSSGSYILGDFRKYDFLDTLRATKLIQFATTDSTLTSGKVNVMLKDYLIKSDIVLTINK